MRKPSCVFIILGAGRRFALVFDSTLELSHTQTNFPLTGPVPSCPSIGANRQPILVWGGLFWRLLQQNFFRSLYWCSSFVVEFPSLGHRAARQGVEGWWGFCTGRKSCKHQHTSGHYGALHNWRERQRKGDKWPAASTTIRRVRFRMINCFQESV